MESMFKSLRLGVFGEGILARLPRVDQSLLFPALAELDTKLAALEASLADDALSQRLQALLEHVRDAEAVVEAGENPDAASLAMEATTKLERAAAAALPGLLLRLAAAEAKPATPALPSIVEAPASDEVRDWRDWFKNAEVRAAAEEEVRTELSLSGPAHDQALGVWIHAYAIGYAAATRSSSTVEGALPSIVEAVPADELAKLAAAVRNATYAFPLQVREASTTELEITDVNGYSLCYFSGMETDQALADFLVAAANAAANRSSSSVKGGGAENPLSVVYEVLNDWLEENEATDFDENDVAHFFALLGTAGYSIVPNVSAASPTVGEEGGAGDSWRPLQDAQPAHGQTIWLAVGEEDKWFYGDVIHGHFIEAHGSYEAQLSRESGRDVPISMGTHWKPFVKPAPLARALPASPTTTKGLGRE